MRKDGLNSSIQFWLHFFFTLLTKINSDFCAEAEISLVFVVCCALVGGFRWPTAVFDEIQCLCLLPKRSSFQRPNCFGECVNRFVYLGLFIPNGLFYPSEISFRQPSHQFTEFLSMNRMIYSNSNSLKFFE